MYVFYILVLLSMSFRHSLRGSEGCNSATHDLLSRRGTFVLDSYESVVVCTVKKKSLLVIADVRAGILNAFDFRALGNNIMLGGALSHKGRFLTVSAVGCLQAQQDFYIFQRVKEYRSTLQIVLNESRCLASALDSIVMDYALDIAQRANQYCLFGVKRIAFSQYLNVGANCRFDRFQFRECGEIFCYSTDSDNIQECPTIILHLHSNAIEIRKPIHQNNIFYTVNRNCRFLFYGVRENETWVVRWRFDRLKNVYTRLYADNGLDCDATRGIDPSGTFAVREKNYTREANEDPILILYRLKDRIIIKQWHGRHMHMPGYLLLDSSNCLTWCLRNDEELNLEYLAITPDCSTEYTINKEFSSTLGPSVQGMVYNANSAKPMWYKRYKWALAGLTVLASLGVFYTRVGGRNVSSAGSSG